MNDFFFFFFCSASVLCAVLWFGLCRLSTGKLNSFSCPLCVAAGAKVVVPLPSDVVQDLSDIGIDSPLSLFSDGELEDGFDDVEVEGAISLSRVRRAGSLAGGTPGQDFPVLNTIPRTNFDCRNKGHGYYADVDTGCQVRKMPARRLERTAELC